MKSIQFQFNFSSCSAYRPGIFLPGRYAVSELNWQKTSMAWLVAATWTNARNYSNENKIASQQHIREHADVLLCSRSDSRRIGISPLKISLIEKCSTDTLTNEKVICWLLHHRWRFEQVWIFEQGSGPKRKSTDTKQTSVLYMFLNRGGFSAFVRQSN